MSRRRITASVLNPVFEQFLDICEHERGRTAAGVAALLLEAGMRVYRRNHNLLCDYPNCKRAECCGGAGVRRIEEGRVVSFLKSCGPIDRPELGVAREEEKSV